MGAVMKAAVYSRKGPADAVLSVVDRPVPQPCAGEVRVRVKASGVNPSDVKTRARPGMAYDEVIPHSDGAGRSEAHTAGRSGRPNSRQRPCASSCTQGTPAGLPFRSHWNWVRYPVRSVAYLMTPTGFRHAGAKG